jgi:hypothetical protein
VAFFAAADAHERANGRIASLLIVSVPRELDRAQQWSILDTWAQMQYPRHPYVIAQHETILEDGLTNPHAHLLYSIRQTDAYDRGARQHFARWNASDPGAGGAQKDSAFDAYGLVRAQRYTWTDVVNWHLDRKGHDDYCDPRSLHVREIPRRPEIRIPSFHGLQVKHRGVRSPLWERMQADRALAQATKPLERQKAQEWWAYRKDLLGLVDVADVPTLVATLRANTQRETQQFRPPVWSQIEGDALTQHVGRVQQEIQAQAVARIQGRPLNAERVASAHRLHLQTDQLLRAIGREREERHVGIERA